jgi:hypothetical protein
MVIWEVGVNDMDPIETLHGIELAMAMLVMLVAGSAAALVAGLVEYFVIRPFARRRGWYE